MKVIGATTQKIRALVSEGESALAAGPHPERARRDAESLFFYLLKRNGTERNTAWLATHGDSPTSHSDEFRALIQRRLTGEPMQYIIGETEFYGLAFRVTPDVLIPRPETEHLVEKAIELSATFQAPRIVDIGTGSGAVAVALARNLSNAQITAFDLSAPALTIARENAELHAVAIRFLQGDLLALLLFAFSKAISSPP